MKDMSSLLLPTSTCASSLGAGGLCGTTRPRGTAAGAKRRSGRQGSWTGTWPSCWPGLDTWACTARSAA